MPEDKIESLDIPRVTFRSRLSAAWASFKSAAPDFGNTSSWSYPFRFSGWGWNRDSTRSITDYRRDLGPLDGNSLVMCVVNYTGTRLPEAQPTVKRKQGDEWKAEPEHPMAALIRRPNTHHVWADYTPVISLNWWVHGSAYLLKIRNDAGQVIGLFYLPHTGEGGFEVIPRWPGDRRTPELPQPARGEKFDWFISHYEFRAPGLRPVLYPAADILHLKRGVNPANPREGLGAFDSLVTELYGDGKMAAFMAAIMTNMGIQVPLISPADGNHIGPVAAAALKEMWIAKTTGSRAGEPIVSDLPVKAEKFGFSPQELDLSALRLIPESRVSAVTGIPAATLQLLVGQQNGTSYASSEQARQQGYEEVIIPIQNAWAEKMHWQLLGDFESNLNAVRFEFDVSTVRVLQEDRDALYRRESEALRAGGQTLNQFLAAVGKQPLGEEGDVYYLPAMSTPATLERIVQLAQVVEKTEPVDPLDADVIDADEVSKMRLAQIADVDQWMRRLEEEMRGFVRR